MMDKKIRFAPELKNGPEIVLKGLDRLTSRENPHKITREAFKNLSIETVHAVYDLRTDEISKGGGLETAHLTGFRYLIKNAGAAVAAAEVHSDSSGNATLLANLNSGPFVKATAQAFDNLPSLDSVRAGSYEARLLRFSSIYLMAIWLKADTGGIDMIYPLAPAPNVLQAEKPYTVDNFLKAIRPLAQKRAEKTNSNMSVP
ncbi:MAG: hypothetical protein ACYDAJ_10945 [Nitrosotalea sp.]